MPFDYFANFPLPEADIPDRLRDMLTPVGLSRDERVEIAARQDLRQSEKRKEFLQMVMAAVPSSMPQPIAHLDEAASGVVEYSTPHVDVEGGLARYIPSISGHDYVVAAWGDSGFYTYHLAEKVWMALGLTARCVGGERQRLVYDDLSMPEYAVAEGEISSEFEWRLRKDVVWTMSNPRLRDYFWMRGAIGARVVYYEAQLHDTPSLRAMMAGKKHVRCRPDGGWCEVDLREHGIGLYLQVWATVVAVSSERCQQVSGDGLAWPGIGPITAAAANALIAFTPVFLDDRFLERYEQDGAYNTTPVWVHGEQWHCSPSYRNQWSFTDCVRVGRNLVRVSLRELYKPKPQREIVHAHGFVIAPEVVAQFDKAAEHIVAKTQRLLEAYLDLGDALAKLGHSVALKQSGFDLTKISRAELDRNGWTAYPRLNRLAQVAPLSMNQQSFLSRCKTLHEFLQSIPNGYLRDLLAKAGVPRAKVKGLGSLKLLQGLLNIVEGLNDEQERIDAFASAKEPEDWDRQNSGMVGLFVTNDLRIADAHEVGGRLLRLEALNFDLAEVNTGYGTALDRLFDSVIESLSHIGHEIEELTSL